jgi:hypothetical protein
MLKTLDVLIGLSVVMLLMSMIVTVITQFLLGVLNSRGKHLLVGIADILEQIDPGIGRAAADEISMAVLSHPLVRNINGKMGGVIHREELTKLLLEFAAGEAPIKLSGGAAQALRDALVATGVCKGGSVAEVQAQIGTVIKNIGLLSLQLELSHPELTNAARARIATLQHASSQFLGKINLWFDQTMDRVGDRFTQHTRYVTFSAGLLIALLLQLDAASLISRLSADDALRALLVEQGQSAQGLQLSQAEIQNVHDLMTNNVVGVPLSVSDWTNRWSRDNVLTKLLGIVLSAVLLSLGAPFWYNALQNLIRLRSTVAVKDDQQRKERQLSAPAAVATAAANAASEDKSILMDERGDLAILA